MAKPPDCSHDQLQLRRNTRSHIMENEANMQLVSLKISK